MDTQQSLIAKENNYSQQNVLIIGGGPAGLATALMLAKRGWKNITVIEKRATPDYYEPDKSFNYLIDGRGQKFTDFIGITDRLAQISVPSTEFLLTQIKPNGSRKTSKIPLVDPSRKTAYWIPRKAFVLWLYEEIQKHWQDDINVLFNTKCVGIEKININSVEVKLKVDAQQENGNLISFEPDLLVGCEGIQSLVRNTLKEWDTVNSDRFEMKRFPSPSSILRYKVLTLPPNFPLDVKGEENAVCDMAYAIRSTFRDRRRVVSLGLLPVKDPNAPRTANVIRLPDHQIWQLKSSAEIFNFLETAFPQLPIRQIVSDEEAERFAKSEGGYFPNPQYCSGLYFLLQQQQQEQESQKSSTGIGIVLLGDAIHCFPPDIGQGVNSALEDVCVFYEALALSNDNILQALPLYESLRLNDTKSLVRLAQTAFPWQYNQDPVRGLLWGINFFIRLILSKLLPFLFSPPSFLLIQNHQLSYQEIWNRVQRTTKVLYVLGALVILAAIVYASPIKNWLSS